jgi:SAM-dependent methyltransferase
MASTAGPRTRTLAELREHYEIEKELANRLRNSSRDERGQLYSKVYNELFQRVPAHPQLTRVRHPSVVEGIVHDKLALLSRFLSPETVFLEVGAGDCRLALAVAERAKQVYAVDVSAEVSAGAQFPPNFSFRLSRGTDIPVPMNSVDVAYSFQLMEHIHPDDAVEQLGNIYNALAPGGCYVCITPNRISGPHDVSRFFDNVASGFHLKEYTLTELDGLFRKAGFADVTACVGLRGKFTEIRSNVFRPIERAIERLPHRAGKALAAAPVFRNFFLAAIVGKKA